MFGSLGNLAGLIKNAKSLQENMQRLQQELADKRFTGEAGAGLVTVEVNGKGELARVKIDPKAAEDIELLEDLIVAATASATTKAHDAMRAEMMQLTGGLNLPGLSEMLGQSM